MSSIDQKIHKTMPSPAPLEMPTQNLNKGFVDPAAPKLKQLSATQRFRFATFLPALATTVILIAIFTDWFKRDGLAPLELAMIGLTGFSAFWIALSVASGTIGLFFARDNARAPKADALNAIDVAMLVPVYNEEPELVFQRIKAMRHELAFAATNHRYAFFILSDTRDEQTAILEAQCFEKLRMDEKCNLPVFYRRRAENTERKTGNLRDWIENWGADWTAFITLDADSLMSAKTIVRLSDELAAAPDTALVQTVPHLIGARSAFAKVQQFANNVHGRVLASGLERWSGTEGNYWGHNAIIRTKAFAACAGLPKLSGRGALGGTIKSHDFVEAALLRRAGWAVRLLPDVEESYEETPQTLIDYVLRDRRWCQGNLQHLRLIGSKGFHAASRFHMFQGAMAYVASSVWFVLLILWTLMGRSEEQNIIRYFTDTNPLFPQWPEMDFVSRTVVLGFMFGLLLAPKLFSMAAHLYADRRGEKFGGPVKFVISCGFEILLSVLLAPIMMVQHVIAVGRTAAGLDAGWAPQNRDGGSYSWAVLARFHAFETVIGLLLMSGIVLGIVSSWLLPIGVSLLLAVPISRTFSQPRRQGSQLGSMLETPEEISPTSIIKRATSAKAGEQPKTLKPSGTRLPA